MEDCQHPLWDFDEEDRAPPSLKWEKEIAPQETFRTFLVMEGAAAVEFADRCLANEKYFLNRISDAKVQLYEDRENSLVLCTSLCDEDTITSDVAELLMPWIDSAQNVVAIKSVPLVYYKSAGEIEDAFIVRALHTEKSVPVPKNIPQLEQPNVLSGISAGVVNLRDHKGMPASIYAYYLQSNVLGLDSSSAKPIRDILDGLKVHCQKEFTTRLKSLSNLYV